MQQIVDYLHQVNTWAAIALLAMVGWLLDSLFWFLETHPLTTSGLATYLSHSWYVLPLLSAIFIILRLRRPSELLALTIYDERGVAIHHQGDFQLEEAVLAPILASFQGTSQARGLHRINLPTGTAIYFLRQGALTLVACFSSPPRPAQLEEGLRKLGEIESPLEDLLGDLPPDVAALTTNLLNAPVERDLLTYLWGHRQVAMTAADLAGVVGHLEDEVTEALVKLERLALICRQHILGITFYRLTDDETWLARLDQFISWRTGWLTRAKRVEQFVGPAK